ncbi:MAG: phospholipase D-like domain-containing protein [bacterium]|nr:phospholipase D-like domain-containing protein [bacterium]
MTELITNREIYERFLLEAIPQSRKFLWLGTADLKDLRVHTGVRRTMIPFIGLLSQLVERGVEIRLLHAKEPGPIFRKSFDQYPALVESERFERALCPRVHFKCVIIDGKRAFIGSANLTGAGIGSRHEDKRNFEAGVDTRDPAMINGMMDLFDRVFLGDACGSCRLRDVCPDPIA